MRVALLVVSVALVFMAAAHYEFSFWHVLEEGPHTRTVGTTIGGDNWLRKGVTFPLYHPAAYVLDFRPWLIGAIYALVTGVAAGLAFVLCKRKVVRSSSRILVACGSAIVAAILCTVAFEIVWREFIHNPPP